MPKITITDLNCAKYKVWVGSWVAAPSSVPSVWTSTTPVCLSPAPRAIADEVKWAPAAEASYFRIVLCRRSEGGRNWRRRSVAVTGVRVLSTALPAFFHLSVMLATLTPLTFVKGS